MTIEITQDIVDIAEEFSMSKYSSKLERDAALLQEIVSLRGQIEDALSLLSIEQLASWLDKRLQVEHTN